MIDTGVLKIFGEDFYIVTINGKSLIANREELLFLKDGIEGALDVIDVVETVLNSAEEVC